MKSTFRNFSRKQREIIEDAAREAESRGYSAYLVGGCVRDLLLNQSNLDVDITIEGDSCKVASSLADKKNGKLKIYPQFQTTTLTFANDLRVDIAMTRKETYASPGALPKVRRGGLQEDLFRRDFTINAMAVQIHPQDKGTLIDPYHGYEDLKGKKIRILHDQSFRDDATRILRAIRFEQRLHFQIERKTFSLLKWAVKEGYLRTVSAQRNAVEFKKMLCEKEPLACLNRLRKICGTGFLFGKDLDFGVVAGLYRRVRSGRLKSAIHSDETTLFYLLAIAEQLNVKQREGLAKNFQLTKIAAECVFNIDNYLRVLRKIENSQLSSSAVYELARNFPLPAIVYFQLRTNSQRATRALEFYQRKSSTVRTSLTGDDLRKMGVVDGQRIGRLLKEVLFKKIDGQLGSREKEEAYIRLSLAKSAPRSDKGGE